MPRLRYLDDDDARRVVTELTSRVFPGSPAFQLRGEEGQAALSSALAQPHWPHHRTLQRKAAVLHYHLNQNHPFVDGNKRFAVTAMEYFLDINRAALTVGDDELYEFSLAVAAGTVDRDESIAFVERRTFRLSWRDDQDRFERWVGSLSRADLTGVLAWLDAGDDRFALLRRS